MKVAIVGLAPSWEEAPFDDLSWDIWSIPKAIGRAPRIDLLFEVHDRAHWILSATETDHVAALNSALVPVAMREEHTDIPLSVKYPLQGVIDRFAPVCPNTPADLFASSVDYMLALAAASGVTEVGLWGVLMLEKTEYEHQARGCQYWIGVLRGLGIPVWIHPTSPICRRREQYGTSAWSAEAVQQRYARRAPL